MFEINQNDVTGTINKLLFNIWQELIKQNAVKPMRPPAEGVKDKSKLVLVCKVCNNKFDNRGVFLKHMKDHKKEV